METDLYTVALQATLTLLFATTAAESPIVIDALCWFGLLMLKHQVFLLIRLAATFTAEMSRDYIRLTTFIPSHIHMPTGTRVHL